MTTVLHNPHIPFAILRNNATISEITTAVADDFNKLMSLGDNPIGKSMLNTNIMHTDDIVGNTPHIKGVEKSTLTKNTMVEMTNAYVDWINLCANEPRGISATHLSKLLIAHSLNVISLLDYRFHHCNNNNKSTIHLKKIHYNSIVHSQCRIRAYAKINNNNTEHILAGVTMLQPSNSGGNKKVELMFKRMIKVNPQLSTQAQGQYAKALDIIRVPYTIADRTRSRTVDIVSVPVQRSHCEAQTVVQLTKHNHYNPVFSSVAHRTRSRTGASKPCQVPK